MHYENSDHVFVDLVPEQFGPLDTTVARYCGLVATAFRYRSGVAGLRISNAKGEIVILPFQGQQIWDATFLNRSLTMRSMFDEPVATRDYLSNYGAFFIHCGATAMGIRVGRPPSVAWRPAQCTLWGCPADHRGQCRRAIHGPDWALSPDCRLQPRLCDATDRAAAARRQRRCRRHRYHQPEALAYEFDVSGAHQLQTGG